MENVKSKMAKKNVIVKELAMKDPLVKPTLMNVKISHARMTDCVLTTLVTLPVLARITMKVKHAKPMWLVGVARMDIAVKPIVLIANAMPVIQETTAKKILMNVHFLHMLLTHANTVVNVKMT